MKKKKFLVLFLGFLLIPLGVFAQEVELTSENKFAHDELNYDMQSLVSYDNNDKIDGYLIIDRSIITKYGLDNKVKWQKEMINPDDLKVEEIGSDNSYGITVKGNSDLYIYQTDSAGNVLWKTQWGGNNNEEIAFFTELYDNKGESDGYLLAALTTSTDIAGIDPGLVLFKLDLNGKLLWQHNFLNFDNKFTSYAVNDTFHNFSLNSRSTTLNHNYMDLNKNSVSYECSYDIESKYDIFNMTPSRDKNGNYDGVILVGGGGKEKKREVEPVSWNARKMMADGSSSSVRPAVIMKVDLNCKQVWKQEYGVDNDTAYASVISSKQTDGNYDGYITVGASRSSDLVGDDNADSVSIINKYDLDGNLVWEKKYSVKDSIYNSYLNINENYDINGNFNGFAVVGGYHVCQVENTSSNDENAKYSVKKLADFNPCPTYVVVNKYTYKDYNVKKEETDKGTVEVNTSNAYPGDIIKVKVTPKTGYMVSKIIVKDSLGREIEVDGDSFVMPEGDVTVSVIYARVTNPVTSAVLDIIIFISIIVGLSTILINSKKQEVK